MTSRPLVVVHAAYRNIAKEGDRMISRLRCRLFGHDLSSFIERTAITYCRRCGATGNVLSRVARQQAVPK